MLFLYDLQSPINIGLTLRAAEQFDDRVAIYDPRSILADPQKAVTISDFSCGAFTRRAPQIVDSLAALRKTQSGRIIATSLDRHSIPLNEFDFREGDVILLGNEYDGLPADVIQNADARLYIPLADVVVPKQKSQGTPIDPTRQAEVAQNGVPNLNVATAAAIISYARHVQRMEEALSAPSHISQTAG